MAPGWIWLVTHSPLLFPERLLPVPASSDDYLSPNHGRFFRSCHGHCKAVVPPSTGRCMQYLTGNGAVPWCQARAVSWRTASGMFNLLLCMVMPDLSFQISKIKELSSIMLTNQIMMSRGWVLFTFGTINFHPHHYPPLLLRRTGIKGEGKHGTDSG